MEKIDSAIDFLSNFRKIKYIYFKDLRHNLIENVRIFIELTDIQQLLYLNEHVYSL